MPVEISTKSLLEAGAHFGQATQFWHPKIKPFLAGAKNGVHIFDVEKTAEKLAEALNFLATAAKKGEKVLFVGTKDQARELARGVAERTGNFVLADRWVGGFLTNFPTIKTRIGELRELREGLENGTLGEKFTKKELGQIQRRVAKMMKTFSGTLEVEDRPRVVFIVDTVREAVALAEAKKTGATIVAIVDSNANPLDVDFPIPANDDAVATLRLIFELVETALKGK